MRISDWSSDVCSSDLTSPTNRDRASDGSSKILAQAASTLSLGGSDRKPTGNSMTRKIQAKAPEGKLSRTSSRRFSMVAKLCKAHSRTSGKSDSCLPSSCQRLSTADTRNSSARIRSEEHTSELQSLMRISYAVFCLKKKTT